MRATATQRSKFTHDVKVLGVYPAAPDRLDH